MQTRSSYRWPNQPNPSPNAWKLWKKIWNSTFKFTSNCILPIDLRLSTWIVPLDKRQIEYEWYFSKESNEIYNTGTQTIETYFAMYIENNNYEANEDSKEKCERIPNDAISITHLHNQKFQIFIQLSFKAFTSREPNDSPSTSKLYHNGSKC